MSYRTKFAFLASVAAVALSASAANAAVTIVSATLNQQTNPALTTVVDFNSYAPGTPANFTTPNGYTFTATPTATGGFVEQGTLPFAYAAPTGDTTPYLALGGTTKFANNSEDIKFAGDVKSAGFYWGSVDTFNTVTFYLNGVAINTITGSALSAFGINPNGKNSAFVTFSGNGGKFDEIKLTTTQPNFEIDNLSIGAIPEPSTWAMMLLGFGGIGMLLYRRSKTSGPAMAAFA